MRSRELWFWLGAAFLTVGAVLAAVAISYFTKEQHYSLSTGPHMIGAYAAFILAFLCLLAAIAGCDSWLPHLLRRSRTRAQSSLWSSGEPAATCQRHRRVGL